MDDDAIKEAISVVTEMNFELYDLCEASPMIAIETNGMGMIITFLGEILWSYEDDDRKFDEDKNEYEDLSNYLKIKINKVIEGLHVIKFKENTN